MQDAALNELLPFGEYVPPERMTASAPQFVMGLDAWELEQLLQRLAAVNGPGAASSRRDRRRHRAAAQSAQQQPAAPAASSARQAGNSVAYMHFMSSRVTSSCCSAWPLSTPQAQPAAAGNPSSASPLPNSSPPRPPWTPPCT